MHLDLQDLGLVQIQELRLAALSHSSLGLEVRMAFQQHHHRLVPSDHVPTLQPPYKVRLQESYLHKFFFFSYLKLCITRVRNLLLLKRVVSNSYFAGTEANFNEMICAKF
jgi:hypothetical protein